MSKILRLKKTRTEFAVKVLLTDELHKFGVNPFNTFLNTVDVTTDTVLTSTTLFDEALRYVEREELPNYPQFANEVFSRRFSFDLKDRIKGFGMIEFENVVTRLVQRLTAEPSINLSGRTLKPVSFEDVHAALKYQIPDINIDEVYVTGSVVEDGERIATRSRRLAEDVHDALVHGDIPYYHGEHLGVYSVAYSVEEQHRHPRLTLAAISDLVIDVVPQFLS